MRALLTLALSALGTMVLCSCDEELIEAPNNPPVLEMGEPREISTGLPHTIRPDRVGDFDGDRLSYEWELVDRPAASAATLQNPTSATPVLTPDVDGDYEIAVSATDGLETVEDDIVLTAGNVRPVADAGIDRSVRAGAILTLDGTASVDPEGEAITYSWSLLAVPPASSASLSNETTATPSLTTDQIGTYQVQLVVDDGERSSLPDEVTIDATATGTVTFTQVKTVMDTITNGSGQTCGNCHTTDYAWAFSNANLSDAPSSQLLTKATSGSNSGHTFASWNPGGSVYELVLDWIEQGALDN